MPAWSGQQGAEHTACPTEMEVVAGRGRSQCRLSARVPRGAWADSGKPRQDRLELAELDPFCTCIVAAIVYSVWTTGFVLQMYIAEEGMV